MKVLVDTNILVRLANRAQAQHKTARGATVKLHKRGARLFVVPQVLYEFWVVCTRPVGRNGLGLNPGETSERLARAKAFFELLPDSEAIFPAWEQLVRFHDVRGKDAHDARLVAAMVVHRVESILTFNAKDFGRFAEITVLDPIEFVMST